MSQVTIYFKPTCPYSRRALKLLRECGVDARQLDVSDDPALFAQMVERSGGRRTVPQVFINARHVGGCDDLLEAHRSGLLEELLSDAPEATPVEGP